MSQLKMLTTSLTVIKTRPENTVSSKSRQIVALRRLQEVKGQISAEELSLKFVPRGVWDDFDRGELSSNTNFRQLMANRYSTCRRRLVVLRKKASHLEKLAPAAVPFRLKLAVGFYQLRRLVKKLYSKH